MKRSDVDANKHCLNNIIYEKRKRHKDTYLTSITQYQFIFGFDNDTPWFFNKSHLLELLSLTYFLDLRYVYPTKSKSPPDHTNTHMILLKADYISYV